MDNANTNRIFAGSNAPLHLHPQAPTILPEKL